jgi:hypothetical protein
MKKVQSKLMLLLAGAALITISACNKSDGLSSFQSSKVNAATNSNAAKKAAVTITAVYDFSTFPNVQGTFTTTGALQLSGTTTMGIGPNKNGIRAHCVVVLTPDDGSGTITIHQECEFAIAPPYPENRGQWQIVSGTGAYTNLTGNGSLTMPPNTEAMTGTIY